MANPTRLSALAVLLAVAGAFVLPGCGNKGSLVRPAATYADAPPAEAPPPPTDPAEADPPVEIAPPPAADPPSDPSTEPTSGDGDG